MAGYDTTTIGVQLGSFIFWKVISTYYIRAEYQESFVARAIWRSV